MPTYKPFPSYSTLLSFKHASLKSQQQQQQVQHLKKT